MKLLPGYDETIIENYNKSVIERIKKVSKLFEIPFEKFAPKDKDGVSHPLGVFETDGEYAEFITQGAKKYAYTKWIKNEKLKEGMNIQEKGKEKTKILEITVAGVPKTGAIALKTLEDFKDDFVFDHKYTNKNLLTYCENQEPQEIVDYLGNIYTVTDKTGCCIFPTTYVLGKALDYAELISDNSSKRAVFKE